MQDNKIENTSAVCRLARLGEKFHLSVDANGLLTFHPAGISPDTEAVLLSHHDKVSVNHIPSCLCDPYQLDGLDTAEYCVVIDGEQVTEYLKFDDHPLAGLVPLSKFAGVFAGVAIEFTVICQQLITSEIENDGRQEVGC